MSGSSLTSPALGAFIAPMGPSRKLYLAYKVLTREASPTAIISLLKTRLSRLNLDPQLPL